MSELVKSVPAVKEPVSPESTTKRTHAQKALELVAMRGKDVIGVRHLLDGAAAWVGHVSDALARVPMQEFGGQPFMAGEVRGGSFLLHIPPKARARLHGADGIARILVGPHQIRLQEGERAVVVLGQVQIRAQVTSVEAVSNGMGVTASAAGWIAFVGAVYIAALALCAALAPPAPPRLDQGAMKRIHQPFMTHLATR